VTGYGAGGIRIQVTKAELWDVLSFCIENQMVSPDFAPLLNQEEENAYAASAA
jgi:hypothetical protein